MCLLFQPSGDLSRILTGVNDNIWHKNNVIQSEMSKCSMLAAGDNIVVTFWNFKISAPRHLKLCKSTVDHLLHIFFHEGTYRWQNGFTLRFPCPTWCFKEQFKPAVFVFAALFCTSHHAGVMQECKPGLSRYTLTSPLEGMSDAAEHISDYIKQCRQVQP